jgi:tRNA-modifying protein YgfZ
MKKRQGAGVDSVLLSDRAVIVVSGNEAGSFLDRILTNNVSDLEPNEGRYAALLSPQGKVIADMIVGLWEAQAGAYSLIVNSAVSSDLIKRLRLFVLRAKVTITDESEGYAVLAQIGAAQKLDRYPINDPRMTSGGANDHLAFAFYEKRAAQESSSEQLTAYHALRIAKGIPEGGVDFAYGHVFPHEINMDLLHGIDFQKGCYVGQEVVSRMQHRGTARTRVMRISYDGGFGPEPGIDILAAGKLIGSTGYSVAGQGLCMIRLDRYADALGADEAITAGGIPARISAPDYAPDLIPTT